MSKTQTFSIDGQTYTLVQPIDDKNNYTIIDNGYIINYAIVDDVFLDYFPGDGSKFDITTIGTLKTFPRHITPIGGILSDWALVASPLDILATKQTDKFAAIVEIATTLIKTKTALRNNKVKTEPSFGKPSPILTYETPAEQYENTTTFSVFSIGDIIYHIKQAGEGEYYVFCNENTLLYRVSNKFLFEIYHDGKEFISSDIGRFELLHAVTGSHWVYLGPKTELRSALGSDTRIETQCVNFRSAVAHVVKQLLSEKQGNPPADIGLSEDVSPPEAPPIVPKRVRHAGIIDGKKYGLVAPAQRFVEIIESTSGETSHRVIFELDNISHTLFTKDRKKSLGQFTPVEHAWLFIPDSFEPGEAISSQKNNYIDAVMDICVRLISFPQLLMLCHLPKIGDNELKDVFDHIDFKQMVTADELLYMVARATIKRVREDIFKLSL